MAASEITLVGGATYRVEGESNDVEAQILAAARGSLLELAWLTEAGTGRPLGINPEHVVALRPS